MWNLNLTHLRQWHLHIVFFYWFLFSFVICSETRQTRARAQQGRGGLRTLRRRAQGGRQQAPLNREWWWTTSLQQRGWRPATHEVNRYKPGRWRRSQQATTRRRLQSARLSSTGVSSRFWYRPPQNASNWSTLPTAATDTTGKWTATAANEDEIEAARRRSIPPTYHHHHHNNNNTRAAGTSFSSSSSNWPWTSPWRVNSIHSPARHEPLQRAKTSSHSQYKVNKFDQYNYGIDYFKKVGAVLLQERDSNLHKHKQQAKCLRDLRTRQARNMVANWMQSSRRFSSTRLN